MFLVMSFHESHKVEIPTIDDKYTFDLKLSWADGMVGAMPIFETYEDAEKYANGKQILEVELNNE